MKNKSFLLKKQPRLLLLTLLGLVIIAPLLMTVLLFIFSSAILESGNNAIPAFLFTAIFYAVTVAALTYWHAVLLQAMHKASQKNFTLLSAFKGTRTIWARTVILWLASSLWFIVFSMPLLYVDLLAIEILLGLILLITPYFALRTSALLVKKPVMAALQESVKSACTLKRVKKWAIVKTVSLVALLCILAGSWSLLVEYPLAQGIRVVLSFLALSWFAVLTPSFSFLLVLGGGSVLHTILLFVVAIALSFSYALLLRE